MSYPSTIGSFTNPNASDKLSSPSHSSIETAQNTALTELQTFVGTLSSTAGTLIYDIRATASDGGGHIQGVNKGGTGLTSYAKGDLIVATSQSVLAKLGVGSDAQVLTADSNSQAGLKWVTNTTTLPFVKTVIPFPVYPIAPGQAQAATNIVVDDSASTMLVGQVIIPFNIVASKITTWQTAAVGARYKERITLYTEAGDSSVFTVTTSVINSGSPSVATSIPSTSIAAGIYYIGVNTSTVGSSIQTMFWVTETNDPFSTGYFNNVVGKEVIQGTVSILTGIPPVAITSSILSSVGNKTLAFRLDE